ncbi:MAG: MBL fold metallo-hydrolase [candidate division Zixibacteria bacterium]|nr:MBL fold metallo-hydrolase [candidate division Zixibacteria bacterium]
MKLGDFEVKSLFENTFKSDGGAMFGVVPKTLWSKHVQADENNMITMNIHPLLIKTGKNNILIDLGIGDCLDGKWRKIYGVGGESQLVTSLADNGLKPEDIDTIIFSHLHADHALGGLKVNESGEVEKIFPNATYYAQKIEIEDALNPNERTSATYFVDLLRHYGEIRAIEGDGKIVDGVAVIRTGGHTAGHQAIFVQSGDESLVYPGDIIPTKIHMRPPWVGAVDIFPLDVMRQKKAIMKECLDNKRYMAFDHDFELKIVKLMEKNGELVTETMEE